MPEGNEQVVDTTQQQSAQSTTTDQNANPGQTTNTPAPRTGQDASAESARQRGMLEDLQRERTQRQQLNTELQRLRAEREGDQRRIRALAGVDTPSDEDREADQIRARFEKLYPWAKGMSQEKLDRILAVAERGDNLEEATQHHWRTHANQQLSSLKNELADALGGELTDRQSKAIARAYAQAAEDDPEFLKRHEAGDPALVKEFVKQWVEDWFEPARRQVTSDAVTRQRRVPNGRDRSVVGAQGIKKIDFKDDKALGDAFVESFRSHGGTFGE